MASWLLRLNIELKKTFEPICGNTICIAVFVIDIKMNWNLSHCSYSLNKPLNDLDFRLTSMMSEPKILMSDKLPTQRY